MAVSNGGVVVTALLLVLKTKHHSEFRPSTRVVSKTSFIETSHLIYFFHVTLHTSCKGRKRKKGKKPTKLCLYLFTLSSTRSSLKLVHYKFSKLLLSHYEMLRHLLSVGELTNVCTV